MKKNKNSSKKKILIVSGLSTLAILGSTLAYFTTSDKLENIFNTALYQHQIVEKFESPSDWTPGTTTEKTIKIANTGSIDMAVRASYTEQWINSNGNEIPLIDSENNIASIINFNDDWTKASDGFYYYGSKSNMIRVAPGEETSSFISGVTFNENIKSNLNKEISADGQTITYSSTGNGYDNATYKLIIKIDTIQYDQSNNIW